MKISFKNIPVFDELSILDGNVKISVIFEIPFSISTALYMFYLSLYMKECGLTDQQISSLIVIGYMFGAIFALFASKIINHLGRKRSTLIFELLAYPCACMIYFVADNYYIFLVGYVLSNIKHISSVAWNCMVIEDSNNRQRTIAFGISNIQLSLA